jgi:hypothetical protein
MKNNVSFHICTQSETPAIVDFLMEIGPELKLSERQTAAEMVDLLFAQGVVVAGYATQDGAEKMVAMMGFFWGDPHKDFANKHIGFVYVAAIAKAWRHTGVFRGLMVEVSRIFMAHDVQEVRFHAEEANVYTNMLYSKIAQPLNKEKNRRGITCILYGTSVANAVAYLQKGARRRFERTRPLVLAA